MSEPTPVSASASITSDPNEVRMHLGEGSYPVTVSVGGHTFVSDAHAPAGGGTGPSPTDLLAAALGACTAMTMRMYADRKRWPIRSIDVAVTRSQRSATDADINPPPSGRVPVMSKRITIDAPELSVSDRERLLQIGEKCPVNQALVHAVDVRREVSFV